MALRFFLVSAVASLGLTLPEGGGGPNVGCRGADMGECKDGGMGRSLRGGRGRRGPGVAARDVRTEGAARGDSAFDVVMEEMVRSFSTGRPAAPAREERATTPAAPTFEPMVIGEDLYAGTAYALNRASEGLDISRLATGEREAPAESQSGRDAIVDAGESGPDRCLAEEASGRRGGDFEPMVVGDDLYVGVAYSLNRASEGLGLASEDYLRASADADRSPPSPREFPSSRSPSA